LAGESAADDILQEVSIKIFRQIGQLREPKVFMPWTFRIATHIAFSHLRRVKRWREPENDPELIRYVNVGGSSGSEDFESDFLSLIDHASPASRAVLLLHYQHHLSLEETAAILDIPIGTAKSRLSCGVAAIRRFIKEKNDE
jgi:RNA polymerase sigma-70 factor (ECF subfamily)